MDDTVEGVPVLMLANKQDMPQALKLESIKEIFNKIAERLGARDSRVLPISALEGYVIRKGSNMVRGCAYAILRYFLSCVHTRIGLVSRMLLTGCSCGFKETRSTAHPSSFHNRYQRAFRT